MRLTLVLTLYWAVMVAARAADPPVAPLPVEVEQGDGAVTVGRLERIDAEGVRFVDVTGGSRSLPADRVRAVRRTDTTGDVPEGRRPTERPEMEGGPAKVVLTLSDGSTLSGDDFAWDGKQPAMLFRPEGRIELPAGRVRSVAWWSEGVAADATPQWQAAVPEGTERDLVVVGTDENHEFVECAITGVSSETVTVVLEEETIPVKRSKVIGLQWLRDEPVAAANAAGRAVVAVTGGGVRASRIEWSVDGLVIDDEIRLPAAMFRGVDYAAGRLVHLASLTTEKIDVEPWFGGLIRPAGRNDAMAAFFAPRMIGPASGEPAPAAAGMPRADAGTVASGIIMRPRTVAVWRLPPDSRRFRAVVAAVAGAQSADATMVTVAVDDRELFRRQIGGGAAAAGNDPVAAGEPLGAGVPIDVDLAAGRRLMVTVDFAAGGGIGGAVGFTNAVIER